MKHLREWAKVTVIQEELIGTPIQTEEDMLLYNKITKGLLRKEDVG